MSATHKNPLEVPVNDGLVSLNEIPYQVQREFLNFMVGRQIQIIGGETHCYEADWLQFLGTMEDEPKGT